MQRKAALLAAAIMALGLCACGETEEAGSSQTPSETALTSAAEESSEAEEPAGTEAPEESSEAEETEDSSEAVPEEESSEAGEESSMAESADYELRPGVWLASFTEDGVREQTYFYFAEDGTGYAVMQENGLFWDYGWTVEGDVLTFHFEDEERDLREVCTVIPGDYNNFSLDRIYRVDEFRYFTDEPLAQLDFHTSEELGAMAINYHNSSDGRGAESFEINIDDDDRIVIYLYEDPEEDPIEVYTVDRFTAEGTDKNNDRVDLDLAPKG